MAPRNPPHKTRASWLNRTLKELVEHLNREPLLTHRDRLAGDRALVAFNPDEIDALWGAWSAAVERLRKCNRAEAGAATRRAVAPLVRHLRFERKWARDEYRTLDDDGRAIVTGYSSARAEALGLVVDLVDFAAKQGRYLAVLDRLRRCRNRDCVRFLEDPGRSRLYCRPACKRASHRPGVRGRVAALRERQAGQERAAGLEAPPGRCRDSALATSAGARERLRVLQKKYGLERARALSIVDREAARVQVGSRVESLGQSGM